MKKNHRKKTQSPKKNDIPKKLISTGVAISMIAGSVPPVFADMDLTKNNSLQKNREILRQVIELAEDDSKTPEQKLQELENLGVIKEGAAERILNNASQAEQEEMATILAEIVSDGTIYLNGEECTLDTIRAMLTDPDVDPDQKVNVDGIEVTMGNLKTMIEIEDRIQEIAESFLLPEDMDEQHRAEYDSIMNQLQTDGIELLEDETAGTEGETSSADTQGVTYDHEARISYDSSIDTQNAAGMVSVTFTQPALEYETSFDWRTADGDAKAGTNYTAASGTVTFAPGETSRTVDIAILEDVRNWNGNQSFYIEVDNAKNILFSNGESSGSININIRKSYDFSAWKSSQPWDKMNISCDPSMYLPNGWDEDYTYGETPQDFQPGQYQVTKTYTRTLTEADKEALANGIITDMSVDSYMMWSENKLMYARVRIADSSGALIAEDEESCSGEEAGAGNGISQTRTIPITDDIRQKLLATDSITVTHVFMYYTDNGFGFSVQKLESGLSFSDNEAPTVESVTVPDGTYYPGQTVPITVTFSEPVWSADALITVNGIKLSPGNTETGSDRIMFPYVIPAGVQNAANIQISGISGAQDFSNNTMDADGQTRVFDQARIGVPREDAFSGISVDKTDYSADGESAQVEIKLDTGFSQWVEQDGGLDQIRISADGGVTLSEVDWKRTDGVSSEDTLTGTVQLPDNTATSATSARIEIFLHEKDVEGSWQLVVGKYCDAVIRAAVYPESVTIDTSTYPEENIIYFVSPPTFTFTTNPEFSSLEPDPQVTWTSSDPTVATIDNTGRVTPLTEGKVFFTVTLQGSTGPVSASTPEFQTRAGDLPFINMSGNITTSIHTDTAVSWNTNVTYKNQQHGVATTTYTVRLYDGDLTGEAPISAEPVKTWTVDNANGFTIPAEYLEKISEGTAPVYTVTVSCGHPDYPDQTLTARAGIMTRALPVVVRFDTLDSYFITDATDHQTIGVTFRNADAVNGVDYSYTIKKNGTTILSGSDPEYTGETLTFDLPISDVPETSLRDIYIVSIQANNPGDFPSADSFILYVYRSGMMDIVVDGEKKDSLVLDNNDDPDIAKTTGTDTTSEEIEQLREDANLSATISIDRGDYEWSNVDDQIAWNSSDNDVANINYSQGGVYSDITQYDYTTFRPSSDFMLVGQEDGTTTITATHAKTGEQTKLDVSVTTLQDKLYVFNFYPRQTTTMTYTNGAGEEVTLTTNQYGEIAVYEESGIASDISLRSGKDENLYLGTLYRTNLLSSENDPSKLELYPLNTFKLRPAAQLDLYLIKEDGTPYSGTLTVSGGVYKNGKYCTATEVKDDTVTIEADGHFHLTLDSTKFWTESNTESLDAGDQLDYVFIARTPNDEYYPLFINVDGSVGTEEAATFVANALVVAKVPEGKEEKPFIAAQTARVPALSSMWSPVLYYNDIIGISGYAEEMEIKTTVLWWGDDSEGNSYDVYMTDPYNSRLTSQKTSAVTRYPFSDILVSENIVTMNKETCGVKSGDQMRPRINIVDGDGNLVLSQDTAFTFMNGADIPLPDTSKEIQDGLDAMQPTGYETDTSDPNYKQGGDMVAPGTMDLLSNLNIESQYLTMALYPTSNPGEWQFLIEIGIDKLKDDGGNSVMLDPSTDRQSYLPGPMDAYNILKGTYKNEVKKDYKESIKSGTGKEASYGAKMGGFYEGIVTWNAEKQKWEMKTRSGGFTYGAAAGYTWSINTMVGPIPITASASIGGGLEMDHKILMTTYSNGLTEEDFQNLLVTMRINAYVKAFVGLGFDISVLALKFGVFGQVDLQNYNAFLYYRNQDTGEVKDINGQYTKLDGSTGIEFYLKILFIKYRKILASAKFNMGEWTTNDWDEIEAWRQNANFPSDFGGYNQNTLAMMMALSSLPEFETVSEGMYVEDRNYLELADRIWGEPNSGIGLFSIDEEEVWQNLQSNSYPYADPMVTEDGQLLVFLSDGGSSDLNRTQVEYSTYNSVTGQYNPPQVLDPQGAAAELADSSLQLAGDSDFAVAVWQRQNQKMDLDPGQEATADDLNAMMSATEIVASVYRNGTWQTEQLTDNNLPDMAPVVATNGDKAIVVWRKVASTSAANVEALKFDAQDELVYRIYDGSTWGEEKTLYNGTMGAVKGLNVAMDSAGNAVVTYTVDSASYIGQNETQTQEDTQSEDAQAAVNEGYEIAYSFIGSNGTAQLPVRFTTDNYSDENPQITAVNLDGEERFVVAWYSQRPLDESSAGTASDAKVGDIQLRVINPDGSLYSNFVDSIREVKNSSSVTIGSEFRFSKGGEDISDLSLIWVSPAMEYVEGDTSGTAFDRDELYAVRFLQEGGQVYLSAPLAVVSAEENTKIDHFDAYLSKGTGIGGGEQIKAVLQTTRYDIDDPALQENVTLDDGSTITLATPISAMKTATADFENSISVGDPIFDYYSVRHDSSLPIQFTVTNTGKSKITKLTVNMTGNGESKTTEIDGFELMPNASRTITVYQPLPGEDTLIENLSYTVTAEFADSTSSSQSGTVDLQLPEVGISSVENTAEENGTRTVQIKMYNQSDIELARMEGYQVKIGFYSDNTCNTAVEGVHVAGVNGTMDENILTISDTDTLSLIDNDAFVGNFTYTLPADGFQGEEEGRTKDITLYVRAWIVDADGNEVTEYYQTNNTGSVTFTDPVARNGGNQFQITSELTAGEGGGTQATVTVKNLALTSTGNNGNLIVSLLDGSGKVIETQRSDLFSLGEEDSEDFTFHFTQSGVAVRCSYVEVSDDETDATLSSLKIDGVPLEFSPEATEYEVNTQNLKSISLSAIASNVTGAKVRIISVNGEPTTSVVLLAEEETQGSGTLDDIIPLRLPDGNGDVETNTIVLGVTPAFGNEQRYTLTIRNQRVATSGNIILETQEYTNQTGMQEVTVRLQNFGSTPESFTIQVDNDTPSSPITWLGSSESRADIAIPEAEGIHTITVKLTDESTYTTNGEITFTVDRTAPLMAENDISFVETDIPLYKANNGVSLLEGVPSETDGITENQLKVYISASDALSGIDRITADAGGRIYTAEWDDEAKKYVLMITYAFRGPLVITAYDKAGNFTSVTKSVNVDDEMPMGTILTGEAVVSYNSARLYGTVTTRDEYLATGGYGIQYRRASDSDTSWNDVLPAEGMPKDGFSVAISGLDPDTDYVYRTFVKSMANVMYYGEIRTFRTAAAPLTGTEIVSFYLEGQVGEANIDSKSGTITVTVPYQTDLEDLSRRLMSAVQISASAGAEVSIEDISVPEGSNTLTANVVVTAEDGTKQTYILTVQAQATPQIADSSFDSLRNEAGEQTITLSGTGLENASSIEILLIDELGQTASRAAAVRNTDGADGTIWTVTVNVPANSSTESDMTYTVAYLIDGVQTTTGTKITVSAASSSDCALLHFDVADAKSVTVDAVTRRITVTMPYDYTEETLNANLSVSAEASYEFRDESGKKIDALPAEGTASLVITAENGTDSVTYTVNVMIDDNLPIETILTGEAIVTSDSSATLYGTVSAQEEYLTAYGIEYRAASATEWIPSEAEEGSSQDGFSVAINGLMPDTDYVYRVYVRDAAEKMHYGEIRTFRTAAAPLTGTEIVSFYLEGRIGEANIDSESGTITVTVPYQTDLEDLSRRLISAVQISASPGAEVSIADISVSEGSNTLTATCTVTAEDGTSKTYLLIVQAQAMPQIDESSFADLTQAAGMQTVTLSGDNLENASSVEILLIDAFGQTASRAAAVWDVNEAAWKATVNVPENSSTETAAVYTVGYVIDGVQTTTGSTITVPEATNSDCALLHFDVTGAESVAVDAVTRNITVTVPYDYGSSEVGVTVSVSEGASYELRDAKGNVIAALPAEGTASLVITAENGTDSVTYTVNVVSQAAPQVHRLAFSSDPLNRQSNLTVHVEGVNLGSAKEIKVTATAADGTSVTAEAQRSGQESYTAMLVIPDYYGIYEDRIFTLSAIVDGVEQTNFDVSQASPVQVKNDNVIESFVIEGQIGETQITHNDGEQEGEIFVLMPNGTDLSALNASWTTRGGVTAQPDTLNDFTSPVIIHLSNSGQADRRYTVTVATQGTPAAEGVEFTAFTSSSAGEITITIRGKNLESLRYTTLKASDGNGGEVSSPVTVADGTLQATLTIPGNTDPTAPAEWTLALERDGAVVQTFSEKIVVQPKLEILSFAIPDQVSCSITDRTIRVRMPAGTDLSALTPQIGLPEGAVILEPQEETVDFTGTVNYRIRLGDDEETYTVIVSRQSSGGGGGGGGGTSTPGTSGDPTDPTEPADPETPTDPTEPTDPETPADPSGQQEWTDNPFEDVSDTDWYYDAVRYVKESGLMQGVSDTSFAPQSNITRGMFVTALYRLEGEPQSQEGSVRFLDVRQSAYYADAVAWASSMGIINGISSTFFAPDRTLTREQMATMIHRYYIYKGEVSSVRTTGNYADYDQISEYAREAVDFCREAGLMTGMENNSFVPKNSSTRAQMAVLLQRMLSGSTEQQ